MALTPNRYTYSQFPAPADSQTEWTEAMGHMVVKRGYHQNPVKPEDEILIESLKGVQNFLGTLIQSTEDKWFYDEHGQAPRMHTREISSNVWLPALGGRQTRVCQREETQYWTFTPLAGADPQNLAKTKRVSAYVVYDQPENPTEPTDADTTAALGAADVTPGPTRDRLFHTGRLWSEANNKGTIIPEEGKNQFTVWVPDVITVTDLVDEEWDRWILVTVTKNALRPGDVQVSDPTEIKKPNIRYSLPVPLDPPELTALGLNDGVKLEVEGGGASLPGGWLNDDIEIVPERYKIFRAIISEPDRTSTPDWSDWWDDGDEPTERNRSVIETTATTELDGTPASPLPAVTGHSEPHDPDPPEPDYETYFELIATVESEHQRFEQGRGYATFTDVDVVNGGEYEYYAASEWGKDESPHSNHETVSYSGSEDRSYRIRIRKGVEEDEANGVQADHVDLLAPDDPSLTDDDYGSVYEFEIPTSDEPLDVAIEVAERQFQQRQKPDSIQFEVLTPLTLEFASPVTTPSIDWVATGNGLIMESQTVAQSYVVVGWKRGVKRDPTGKWGDPKTTITCQEYPR
jgi:hypothetical protein